MLHFFIFQPTQQSPTELMFQSQEYPVKMPIIEDYTRPKLSIQLRDMTISDPSMCSTLPGPNSVTTKYNPPLGHCARNCIFNSSINSSLVPLCLPPTRKASSKYFTAEDTKHFYNEVHSHHRICHSCGHCRH